MATYKQETKEKSRELSWSHAIESLTTRRDETRILNRTYLIVVYVALLLLWPKSFRVLISMQDLNLAGIGISLLATLILIELCKLIRRSKLLNYIGQNTIGFYFMSGALPIVLSMAVKHFLPESGFAGFAIVFTGSMVIAYFVVRLINRWLPWMLDLREIRRLKV